MNHRVIITIKEVHGHYSSKPEINPYGKILHELKTHIKRLQSRRATVRLINERRIYDPRKFSRRLKFAAIRLGELSGKS